jgi:hypothetical protein
VVPSGTRAGPSSRTWYGCDIGWPGIGAAAHWAPQPQKIGLLHQSARAGACESPRYSVRASHGSATRRSTTAGVSNSPATVVCPS